MKTLASSILGAASLVFMLIAMLFKRLFGPLEPWTFKRKLNLSGLGCLLLLGAYVACCFTNADQFNGPAWQWMLYSCGLCIVLYLVNFCFLLMVQLLENLRHTMAKQTPPGLY